MKKRYCITTILMFFFSCNLILAQNTTIVKEAAPTTSSYEKDAIYLQTSFWSPFYVKNGQEYRMGFAGKNLKKEFEGFPEAKAEYQNFIRQRRIAIASSVVGSILLLVAANSALSNNSPDITDGQKVMTLGGFASIIVSVPATIKMQNSLSKAIYLRNGALCK